MERKSKQKDDKTGSRTKWWMSQVRCGTSTQAILALQPNGRRQQSRAAGWAQARRTGALLVHSRADGLGLNELGPGSKVMKVEMGTGRGCWRQQQQPGVSRSAGGEDGEEPKEPVCTVGGGGGHGEDSPAGALPVAPGV